MIEIFLLWQLTVYIGNKASFKGLPKFRYQLMAVLVYFGFMLSGVAVGMALFPDRESMVPLYIVGVLGGLLGVGISLLIMRLVPGEAPRTDDLQPDPEPVPSGAAAFLRSRWIPVLAVLISLTCLVFTFLGLAVSSPPQRFVSYLQVGTELDANGALIPTAGSIPSSAEAILISVYIDYPLKQGIDLVFDIHFNGQRAYAFSSHLENGYNTIALDRPTTGRQTFYSGEYELYIYYGDLIQASTSFIVE